MLLPDDSERKANPPAQQTAGTSDIGKAPPANRPGTVGTTTGATAAGATGATAGASSGQGAEMALAQAEPTENPTDIFAVRTWEPPAPIVEASSAAPPPPPPPPEAPPLPFRYLGKIAEPGEDVAFILAQGEKVISVSVGDAIDDTYKVVRHEGGELYFLFRPMQVQQSLSVGGGERLSG